MYLYKLQNSVCIYTPLQSVKSVTPTVILFFPQIFLQANFSARERCQMDSTRKWRLLFAQGTGGAVLQAAPPGRASSPQPCPSRITQGAWSVPLHALAKEPSSTQVTMALPIPRQKTNRNNSFYTGDWTGSVVCYMKQPNLTRWTCGERPAASSWTVQSLSNACVKLHVSIFTRSQYLHSIMGYLSKSVTVYLYGLP